MKYTFLHYIFLLSYNKKLKQNVFNFLNHLLKALKPDIIQSLSGFNSIKLTEI